MDQGEWKQGNNWGFQQTRNVQCSPTDRDAVPILGQCIVFAELLYHDLMIYTYVLKQVTIER